MLKFVFESVRPIQLPGEVWDWHSLHNKPSSQGPLL